MNQYDRQVLEREDGPHRGRATQPGQETIFARGRAAVRQRLQRSQGVPPDVAEDIAQDVALRLWRQITRGTKTVDDLIDVHGAPSGIWYRAAIFRHRELRAQQTRQRRAWHRRGRLDSPLLLSAPQPLPETVVADRQTLRRLNADSQLLVAVASELGLSDAQLARHEGVSRAAIRKRRQRFRAAHRAERAAGGQSLR